MQTFTVGDDSVPPYAIEAERKRVADVESAVSDTELGSPESDYKAEAL